MLNFACTMHFTLHSLQVVWFQKKTEHEPLTDSYGDQTVDPIFRCTPLVVRPAASDVFITLSANRPKARDIIAMCVVTGRVEHQQREMNRM
jgi:hypothetical protein